MSRAQQLYQLQTLDSEVDKINRQLAEIAAQLGESAALKQAKVKAEAMEKALHQAQAAMQNLNLETRSLADKIAQQEKTLYQGKALSPKEATNLQDEITSLKRRHSQREELLLEAMVGAEEAERQLDQARTQLAATQAQWQAEQAELTQQQSSLKSRAVELREQRPVMIRAIDADDLDDYEDLRPKKAGRAVAVIKDGICQGCGVAASSSRIQHARAGAELVYCGTCGRILYVA
ncbi:MAG TPA: C4-type zinc ribbon domain-containing protein [Anaerolineae bacterium]|nr:C4-type zinc ribbon domain-containing protein [Anaerolineae bacterium]HXW00537.1 C4-type zinc ribbon domain-containing protein [Anaerolineae bacterium]